MGPHLSRLVSVMNGNDGSRQEWVGGGRRRPLAVARPQAWLLRVADRLFELNSQSEGRVGMHLLMLTGGTCDVSQPGNLAKQTVARAAVSEGRI